MVSSRLRSVLATAIHAASSAGPAATGFSAKLGLIALDQCLGVCAGRLESPELAVEESGEDGGFFAVRRPGRAKPERELESSGGVAARSRRPSEPGPGAFQEERFIESGRALAAGCSI